MSGTESQAGDDEIDSGCPRAHRFEVRKQGVVLKSFVSLLALLNNVTFLKMFLGDVM